MIFNRIMHNIICIVKAKNQFIPCCVQSSIIIINTQIKDAKIYIFVQADTKLLMSNKGFP